MTDPQNTQQTQRDPDTGALLGAAARVHFVLGPGFLEAVYQDALAVELRRRGIEFEREVWLPIMYEGEPLSAKYRVDFLSLGVLVELKALPGLTGVEQAQIINYLRARAGVEACSSTLEAAAYRFSALWCETLCFLCTLWIRGPLAPVR